MGVGSAVPKPTPGEVVEWSMAPVLKTGEVKASVGSNPTLSAEAINQKVSTSSRLLF
jgi:hypothetical protein